MPRPCCPRRVGFTPGVTYFKPAGVPLRELEEVVVTLDELEALRLADLNGLYQEKAAEEMKISRPTFARVVESARKKVADALIHGKALRMEGGAIIIKGEKTMPGRDGTGPMSEGRGRGRGRCGWGQRRRCGGGAGMGGGLRGKRHGQASDISTAKESEKGEQPS
ncbi:MAG TPA: DUF134 domain-containing protein [Kiritimatiellia bacterium]|nr:DUF134 domain-containing protein [Kiritimatiellia bacterium]